MSGKRVSDMTDAEIRELAAQAPGLLLPAPRLVIAVDDAGRRVAIGPGVTNRSVDELRRQVDDYGWDVLEVVPVVPYHWRARTYPWAVRALARAEAVHGRPDDLEAEAS